MATRTLFTTKGLFVNLFSEYEFAVEDVFGTSSLRYPYNGKNDLEQRLLDNFNILPLVDVAEAQDHASLECFSWPELEHYYVAHLDYALTGYLINQAELQAYYQERSYIPIAYLEYGLGQAIARVYLWN